MKELVKCKEEKNNVFFPVGYSSDYFQSMCMFVSYLHQTSERHFFLALYYGVSSVKCPITS